MILKLSCYVVDDEPHCVHLLEDYIAQTDALELIGTSHNPLVAIGEIKSLQPDIVFTDINMPYMSGLVMAEHVDPAIQIVFVSANFKSSFVAIDWKNHLYLSKLLTYKRFMDVVTQIRIRKNK